MIAAQQFPDPRLANIRRSKRAARVFPNIFTERF